MSGKWLELLKEVAPGVARAAVLRDVTIAGTGEFAAIQAVAPPPPGLSVSQFRPHCSRAPMK